MCRLFVSISTDKIPVADPFLNWSQSLVTLSHTVPERAQKDGWGLAWYDHRRLRLMKSAEPAWTEIDRIKKLTKGRTSHLILGHVRWASNPMKLPPSQISGRDHNQPFTHGAWSFVHNGTLNIPEEVKSGLGPWRRFIRGNNDSEVLFYWLMKTVISRKGAFPSILKKSLRELEDIWAACRGKYPQFKGPYHGLNFALSDGRETFVFCCEAPGGFSDAKALADNDRPYFQLQACRKKGLLCLASEPLDSRRAWKPVAHGQLLKIVRQPGRIAIKRSKILEP